MSFVFALFFRYSNHPNRVIASISNLLRGYVGRKHEIQIPRNTSIGPGLSIAHAMCIVMHPNVKIGKNCTIHQFVTLGGVKGKAPVIGDNVFIGAAVTIVGGVKIGDNVTIGAGAVVVSDIPDNATVAGNPAKVIHFKNPGSFQQNLWMS